MLYQSTRGGGGKVSFEEAIIKGIADDGGLYVPERIPRVSGAFIAAMAGMCYPDTAAKIIGLYAGGGSFSEREIAAHTGFAYSRAHFDDTSITPLKMLDAELAVLELFHGPTSAFKDLALQLLPSMLSAALQKTGVKETVSILVATSGDTGKAALEGFRDVPGVSILVFYPKDGVSEAQKLQMITQEGGNVAVAAVEGNFDDAQTGVKAIFADAGANAALRQEGIRLSSANSINWGRLVPQIAYYFRAYAELLNQGAVSNGEPINFVVPTGNFGNILAGWYAREMGLPISRFYCASNSNNVLTDFINTGVYDKNRDFAVTMSPAMDILVSSNLERLLYELSGRDAGRVSGWMAELAAGGKYDVGGEVRAKIAQAFTGGFATEAETSQAVGGAYRKYGYLPDTHTAVGFHVYGSCVAGGGAKANKTVIIATASPYKFAKDVYLAIGAANEGRNAKTETTFSIYNDRNNIKTKVTANVNVDDIGETDDIQYIDLLSAKIGEQAPAPLRGLREKPIRHFTMTSKSQMKDTAINILCGLKNDLKNK